MTKLDEISKRLAELERPESDLIDRALNALSYEQVLLLEEAKRLDDAGFDEEHIQEMMGDRYQAYKNAMQLLNEEYSRLSNSKRKLI